MFYTISIALKGHDNFSAGKYVLFYIVFYIKN